MKKSIIGILLSVLFTLVCCATAFAVDETTPTEGAETTPTEGAETTPVNQTNITATAGAPKAESAGATIVGKVEPIVISAIVPTTITFTIDPNKEPKYTVNESDTNYAFTSPAFSFTNSCNAPLTFSVAEIKAGTRTKAADAADSYAPKDTSVPTVVAPGTFTSDVAWNNLTTADTAANIAFGFQAKESTDTAWIPTTAPVATPIATADAGWYDGANALTLGTIVGKGTVQCLLKAKHGMAWSNTDKDLINYSIKYSVALAA